MKKIVAILLAMTLSLGCITFVSFLSFAASDKAVTAAWGSPTIDGQIDDVWNTAVASTFKIGNGSVRFLNDADYLYALIEIADATVAHPSQDYLYFMFDLDNDGQFDSEKVEINDYYKDGTLRQLVGGVVQEGTSLVSDWAHTTTSTGHLYEFKLQNVMSDDGFLMMEVFYREMGGSGSTSCWSTDLNYNGWPNNSAATSTFGKVTFATAPASGDDNDSKIPEGWGTPVIDGTVDEIWSNAQTSSFKVGNGNVRFLNDANYLYLLVEITDATTAEAAQSKDYFYVLLDLDNDGVFDDEKLQLYDDSVNTVVPYEKQSNVLIESGTYVKAWVQEVTATGYIYEIQLQNVMPDDGYVSMELFYREKDTGAFEAYWQGGNPNGWPTNAAPTSNFGKVTFATAPVVEPTYDYTASLTGPAMDATVGDEVTFVVNVDNTFAAGEVTLSYDKALLTPVAGEGIKIGDGTVTVVAYGADKTTLDVVFTAKAAGTAKVTLTDAAFSTKEDAATEDLTDAAIETSEASVVIAPAELSVTLPEIFEGNSAVANGSDYTFTAKDTANYTYQNVAATMGGATVEVIDNGDGTYTVKNVTGDLVITGERVANSYSVTVDGEAAEDATYGEDYVITLPENVPVQGATPGKTYAIGSITIGGTAYTAYAVDGRTVTIDGTAITGDIVVTITETTIDPTSYAVVINKGAYVGDVDANASAVAGVDYTFGFSPLGGFTYEVTATVNGTEVTVTSGQGGEWTIAGADVTGDIEITITATLDKSGVAVNEYVQLDGTAMWLVTIADSVLEPDLTYTFNGNVMYMNGGKYVYLVIAETLTVDEAKALVDVATGTAKALTATNDVNGTGAVDANDAQFVYNMYNAMYPDFATVSMEKFLLADVNADGVLDTADAAAIVVAILN